LVITQLVKFKDNVSNFKIKIDGLEEKLIAGGIDAELFKKWNGKSATEVESLAEEKNGYFDRSEKRLPAFTQSLIITD